MMTQPLVLLKVDDGVATLTFNRPDRMNAWTPDLENEYFALLDRCDDDADVRAIVVTGSGRAFCAGMDARVLDTMTDGTGRTRAERGARSMAHPVSIRKPLIAAINGGCAGIGLIQALVADVRFAAPTAKITTAFARRGVPAEFGAAWLLTRIMGHGRAMEFLLSGRAVLGEEARTLGLVSYVAEDVVDAATAYARELASFCAPSAMAHIKAQVWGDWFRTRDEAEELGTAIGQYPEMRRSLAEGIRSFTEKRPPAFDGLERRR